ncbi:DUF998 domain-containing protein [Aureisphaera galaxeae]|uniref:DUF998 domain-containing protein n=1 Tax=Aureisphaera galaxeae TaxID=1538023 RepID=UPI00234FE148|nr:DUF998 domain-containing protein [Aureisphaera galaxeae]MDC8003769.1 DUF998 domain-containing protein [Aureisphaera galaxeae]
MKFVGTLYALAYLFMLVIMFLLPKFSFSEYSMIQNSLSELGAQNTPASWVMNMVFFMLAFVVILLATKKLRRFWLPLYLLYLFALCLFFTGIYRHAPIVDIDFSMPEHITHSVFSSLTGIVFCMYCATIVVFVKRRMEKATAIFMCALALGLSLLMFQFSEYKGVFQRILFILAFGWLLYSLVTFTFEKPKAIRREK